MKKILILLVFLAVFLLSGRSVSAACNSQYCDPPNCQYPCDTCGWCQAAVDETGRIKNPVLPEELSRLSGESFLEKFLNLGITVAFIIGSLYFFFMLLSGAIRWISSSGDKAGIETAQKRLTHAFLGLAILFASFAIIKLIEHFFGVNIINISLPTL